jgi:hypothetical protein
MNRDTKKTALCRYEKRKGLFLVESPLLEICHGVGKTEKAAWEIFNDLLNAMYIEYLEGKTAGKYAIRGGGLNR